MTNRGRFLELSIPTDAVRESLDFYLRLGFTELPVNDIRGHFYAVVTDGRIAIGLHSDGFAEPTLSFVWPDVARHVRELEDAGHELTVVELGIDEFHEVEIFSPDGHPLRFMEARTFSRRNFRDAPEPAIGRSAEISLRCADYGAAFAFWETADFITEEDAAADPDEELVTLWAPGVMLGLRNGYRWPEPGLRFGQADIDATLEELDRRRIAHRRSGTGRLVTAPEGTRLILVDDERRSADD